jgi:hypothetical protein
MVDASGGRPSAQAPALQKRGSAMLPQDLSAIVAFPASFSPRLLVIVDAEEAFDWNAPFARSNTTVDTRPVQGRSRAIFERFGITPSYVVDFPVASQSRGVGPLLELLQSGRCQIGAQLHSWVTPPFEEMVSEQSSYANNLAPALERRKIVALTETIEEAFRVRPLIYRGGRYGAGAATLRTLEELKYTVDCSVLPGAKLSPSAPDYRNGTEHPYWLGSSRSILEIPVTAATVGVARRFGNRLHQRLSTPVGRFLKMPAFASRFGIVDRIRLTPEGITIDEAKKLTRTLVAAGNRVFALSYHSPSLEPGNTPYVRDMRDLEKFHCWIEEYLDFFFAEMHGAPSTPQAIFEAAMASKPVPGPA